MRKTYFSGPLWEKKLSLTYLLGRQRDREGGGRRRVRRHKTEDINLILVKHVNLSGIFFSSSRKAAQMFFLNYWDESKTEEKGEREEKKEKRKRKAVVRTPRRKDTQRRPEPASLCQGMSTGIQIHHTDGHFLLCCRQGSEDKKGFSSRLSTLNTSPHKTPLATTKHSSTKMRQEEIISRSSTLSLDLNWII